MSKPPHQKPKLGSTPARGAGRTIDWGLDDRLPREDREQYIRISALDGAQQALLNGHCARCDNPYRVGDWVFRGRDGELVAVNCCAVESDTRRPGDPVPLGLGDMEDLDDAHGRDLVPLSQVMPSNKTKADMCQRCFQIPAANGVCGC
jgi:hypothetical protein